jgi:hypothetical protein
VRGQRIKSSPGVKSGSQYRAARSDQTPPDHNIPRPLPRIVRQHPGRGYRHILRIRDVNSFLTLLPDWSNLSLGLNVILLAPPRLHCDGFHRPGLVAICAQPRNLSQPVNDEFVVAHRELLRRLNVPLDRVDEGWILHFTEQTLRAYQLLHVLLHELGHHYDRMTTRSKRCAARGESFAELYAKSHANLIWARYVERFGQ